MERLAKIGKSLKGRLSVNTVHWLLAAFISGCIILVFHSAAVASQPPTTDQLADFINGGSSLPVDSVSQRGNQHVYYLYNDNAFYLTEGPVNNGNPHSEGRFVVWERKVNGRSQIVLHDLLAQTSLQLTASSSNKNPRVDRSGSVVWERWDGSVWQVYYYNYPSGGDMQQVTEEPDSAVRADVNGQEIVYARRLADGTWEAVRHDLESQTAEVISSGNSRAAWPQFKPDGTVTTDAQSYLD